MKKVIVIAGILILSGNILRAQDPNDPNQNNTNTQAPVDPNAPPPNTSVTNSPTAGTDTGKVAPKPKLTVNVLDGVYIKEHVPERQVIPYAHLREADVNWSKRIWRMIDINEKMNLVFKWPKSESTYDRMNLLDIMMKGILEGNLTAYDADELLPDEFARPYTRQEIEDMIKGKADTKTIKIPDPPYEKLVMGVKGELKKDDVFSYELKEDWFFDKQRSVMDVRIIGVCPISYVRDDAGDLKPGAKKKLFWIYFPEARRTFVNAEVFNTYNDAERRTWDDIFFKRKFSSYIIKESNVYDRHIFDYKLGMDALLEAEAIKKKMVEYEHDMWEY